MELWKFEGKKVKLTSKTGKIFEGVVGDYIYPEDNEPEGMDAVVLDYPIRNDGYQYQNPVQFNADEIQSIEIIN